MVWQRWWARAAGVALSWREEVILALAVWLIYLADRWADTGSGFSTEQTTARHAFCLRHRPAVGRVAVGLLLLLAVVTPCWLTPPEFFAGLGLLGLAGVYFGLTHRWTRCPWTTIMPKEAAVGGLFALGSSLFVLTRLRAGVFGPPSGTLWLGVGGFAALCFINCALITRWESSPRDLCDPTALFNAFPRVVRFLPVSGVILAAVALALVWQMHATLLLPVAAAASLLVLLDLWRHRFSRDALRVLADIVLLTPLIFFGAA